MTNRVGLRVAAVLSHETSAAVSSCPATRSDERLVPPRRPVGDVASASVWHASGYIAGGEIITQNNASWCQFGHQSPRFSSSRVVTFLFQVFWRAGLRQQNKPIRLTLAHFQHFWTVHLNKYYINWINAVDWCTHLSTIMESCLKLCWWSVIIVFFLWTFDFWA